MKKMLRRLSLALAGVVLSVSGTVVTAEVYPLGLLLRIGGSGVERVNGLVELSQSRVKADDGIILTIDEAEEIVWYPKTGLIPSDPSGALAANGEGGTPHMVSWLFSNGRSMKGDWWIKVSGAVTRREFMYWTLLLPDSEKSSQSMFEFQQTDKGDSRWVRVGPVNLGKPGDYRLFIRIPRESVKVEGMAILPSDVSPEKAKVTLSSVAVDTGEVYTEKVNVPDARAIRGAEVTGWNGQGEVRLALAIGSEDWHWIQDGKLPDGVKISSNDAVRAKVVLRATDTGRPIISGVNLLVEGGYWPIMESPDAIVHLDQAGGIFRILDLKSGRNLLWPTVPVFPFAVDLKEFGKADWVRYSGGGKHVVRMEGGRETATAEAKAEAMPGVAGERLETLGGGGIQVDGYESLDDGGYRFRYVVAGTVEVLITHRLEGEEYHLDAELINDGKDEDVIRFTFPRLERLRLGDSGYDDYQLRMQNYDHLKLAPGLSPLRDTKYPGALIHPWESLEDEKGGLAIISLDPLGRNLQFSSRSPLFFGDTYNLETSVYDTVPAMGGEGIFNYVLLIHPFRWHVAADYYREWFNENWESPHYPDWLLKQDGFYNVQWQEGGSDFMNLLDRGRTSSLANLNYIHVWGQMTGPKGGCCSTFPEPSPLFGGVSSFTRGVAALDKMGVRAGFYFLPDRLDWNEIAEIAYNGTVWREEYPETTVFPTLEFLDSVRWVENPDGRPVPFEMTEQEKETLRKNVAAYREGKGSASDGRRWIPADLTDPRWQKWVADWAQRYVDEWGVHSLYYDVMGTGAVRESYDGRKLDHGKGRWGFGRAETVQRTRERLDQLGHSDAAILVEGAMDLSGQWAAHMVSGLYRNRIADDDLNQTDVVRYTFPDRILFDGHSNQGNLSRVVRVKGAFLNGNRLDLVYITPVTVGILNGREAIRNWLYPAAFRHTLGLEAPVPARIFRLDEAERSGVVMTVVNDENTSGKITYVPEDDFSPKHAFLVRTNGVIEPWTFDWDGAVLTTPVPDTEFGTILFVESARGLEDALITYVPNKHDPEAKGQLYLANPGETPLRLRIDEKSPTAGASGSKEVSVPPGQVTVLEVTPWKDEIGGLYEARIVSDSGQRELKRHFFPLFDKPAFESRFNDSETHEFHSFKIEPGQGVNYRSFNLHLQPGETYRYRIEYFKTPGESRISQATVSYHLLNEKSDQFRIPLPVENRWAVAEGEFTVPKNAFSAALYLHNWDSTRTLWIRDITISK